MLADIVRSVTNAHPGQDPPSLALFAAARGSNSTGELMVVGRATNGWGGQRFREARRESDRDVDAIVGAAFGQTTWIDSGPTRETRSAFWRVCRRISADLLGPVPPITAWSSRLIWSNLYKVAPALQGNPSGRLLRLQHAGAKRLLFAEFEHFRPRRVLLLTGWDWAKDFLDGLESCGPFPRPDCVQEVLRLPHGALAVVVRHPQGKPEGPIRTGAVRAFAASLEPSAPDLS